MPQLTSDITAPVKYVRSRRARRLRITICPEPEVRVTLPPRMTLDEANRFVASKRAWIDKHLHRVAVRQQHQTHPPDLSKIDLVKAQNTIFERLEALSQRHHLPYRRAAFRCQKTRWGSCSPQNNISLNINMVFLPTALQDYLLLHELTHIRHKNHSHAFWADLDRLCQGCARHLSRQIKRHTMWLNPTERYRLLARAGAKDKGGSL